MKYLKHAGKKIKGMQYLFQNSTTKESRNDFFFAKLNYLVSINLVVTLITFGKSCVQIPYNYTFLKILVKKLSKIEKWLFLAINIISIGLVKWRYGAYISDTDCYKCKVLGSIPGEHFEFFSFTNPKFHIRIV